MSRPLRAHGALRWSVGCLLLACAADPPAAALAIREILCDPPLLDLGGEGRLEITLANDGASSLSPADLRWDVACPLVDVGAPSVPPGTLRPGESSVFAWTLLPRGDPGVARLSISLAGPGGERAGSDVRLRVGRGPVWISEIQYDPSAGEGEWIELACEAGEALDLTGWQVQDATRRATRIGSATLAPGEIALLAESPVGLRALWPELRPDAILPRTGSWPSLNNSFDSEQGFADQIVLLDAGDLPIDYVRYIPGDLDGDGVSLERWIAGDRLIDPTVLIPCSASRGSTPGGRERMPASGGDAGEVALDPSPFFADRAAGPQLCRIVLPRAFAGTQQVTADIFSIAGERVATLVAGARASGPVILAWNGRRADGRALPTGLYVVRAVLRSTESGRTRTQLRSIALVHE